MRNVKWLKKAAAMLLAGTLMCGTAAWTGAGFTQEVKADTIIGQTPTTGTLTINKTDGNKDPLAGATFKIYKVISLTPGAAQGEFAKYEKVSEFNEVLKDVDPDDLGNFSAQQIENLAAALAAEAAKLEENGVLQADGEATTEEGTGQAVFSDLALGYYLVVETAAPEGGYVTGEPFLVAIPSTDNYDDPAGQEEAGTAWVYDVVASPKNTQTSVNKEIDKNAQGNDLSTDGTVEVGDFVPYKITTEMPDYSDGSYQNTEVTFTLTDEMSAGLEIQKDEPYPITVKVNDGEVLAGDETYRLTAEPVKENGTADLTVAFASAYIKKNPKAKVEITYYAKVTEDAVMGQAGNTNQAKLEITNNPDGSTEAIPAPEVTVYSFGLKVVKFEKDGTPKKLAGAEFELHKDSPDGTLVGEKQITKEDGILSFDRLDEGLYYLVETKAPAGYTLLSNPIKVQIKATQQGNIYSGFELYINDQKITATSGEYESMIDQATGTSQVAVENHKGFTLPATGGMGIVLFLAVGVAGIVAVSVLLTRKSKDAK